jgi:hypothetical protein
VVKLVVVTQDFVSDLTPGFDNQARYPDKGVQEALELHPNDFQARPIFNSVDTEIW